MAKASRCRIACAATLFAASALLAALFAYAAVTCVRYTPAYSPLSCTQLPNMLGTPTFGGEWINATGFARKQCENPNVYPVTVSNQATGPVFAKTDDGLVPIGLGNVQPITFPAHGEAIGEETLNIALNRTDLTTGMLLALPVLTVVTEVYAKTSATISFLGVGVTSSQVRSKLCGFQVSILLKKVGPTECVTMPNDGGNRTALLEELVIPDVNDDRIVKSLVNLSPEDEEKVARMKNGGFGGILAASGVLSVVCLLCALALARPCCCRRGAKEDAREMNPMFDSAA